MPIISTAIQHQNKEAADQEYILNYLGISQKPKPALSNLGGQTPTKAQGVLKMQFCVRLHHHKSHCIGPFVLPGVLPPLFQHSDNHMMSHTRREQKGILQSNFLAESTPETAHSTAVPALVTVQTQEHTVKGNRA